ncbi:methyltransferase domain-containing protein [Streptomyces sp. NPDC048290]|uniref:methyltransferase domain-containing protein n=1 Tax=Streptomyces sp. NPDC048290 TaxID=3155811 RepID=UPI0034439A55
MSTGHDQEALAAALVAKGVLTSDWLPAFHRAPRHHFVPDTIWPGRAGMNRQDDRVIRSEDPELWWNAVHTDAPITTQWDDGAHTGPGRGGTPTSSSSMPTMVFAMLDALTVDDDHRVLEIGTGTGWNAALLSHRVGPENVVTIEVDPATADAARKRIRAVGLHPLCVVGDGAAGYPEAGPYDRVVATCSVGEVPAAWIRQTRPGGIIVAPWGPTYGGEGVVRLVVQQDGGTASGRFVGSSAFMRLRDQRIVRRHVREYLGGQKWPGDGVRSMTSVSPDDVGEWLAMFAIGLQTRGVHPWAEMYGDGTYTLWLRDLAVSSWATVDYVPEREEFEVYQSGARRLWDEVVVAHLHWHGLGRPGWERFGLTVDVATGGHVVWLDSPDQPLSPIG